MSSQPEEILSATLAQACVEDQASEVQDRLEVIIKEFSQAGIIDGIQTLAAQTSGT
jgi:hypothetical protein